jgi:hypothetical protein
MIAWSVILAFPVYRPTASNASRMPVYALFPAVQKPVLPQCLCASAVNGVEENALSQRHPGVFYYFLVFFYINHIDLIINTQTFESRHIRPAFGR